MNKWLLILMLSIIFPFIAFCQQDTVKANSVYHQQDIKDWLAQKGWIKEKPAKDKFLLIIPIIASNPAAANSFASKGVWPVSNS